MRKIGQFVKPAIISLLFVAFIGIIITSLDLLSAFLLKLTFDEGIMKTNFKFFAIMVISIILLNFFNRLIYYFYVLAETKLKLKFTKEKIVDQIKAFQYIPYSLISKRDSGYFISRIYEDTKEAGELAIDLLLQTFRNFIYLIGSLSLCLYISPRATIILGIIIPGLTALSRKFSHKIKQYTHHSKTKESEVREILSNIIKSFENLQLYDLWNRVIERFEKVFEKSLKIRYTHFKTTNLYQMLSSIFLSLNEFLAITVSGYLILTGKMTFGGFLAFMQLFWGFIRSIDRIIQNFAQFPTLLGLIERIEEFRKLATFKMEFIPDKKIEIKNLSFSYDHKPVFKNFNLEVKSGEKVLITGENGSGKTTLFKLLSGLLKPSKGLIKRPERLSIMPYSNLPPMPVKDFKILDQRGIFEDMLEKFKIAELKNTLPSELSQGQRKRLQIILALVKDADAYLLDEPLANIDPEMRKEILNEIFERTKGKTLLIIGHDLDREEREKFSNELKLMKP